MRNDIVKDLSEIIESHMKEHWEIHKEKTSISLRPYMMRMLSEAYILGRVHKIEEDESIQETNREIQGSKRSSCC